MGWTQSVGCRSALLLLLAACAPTVRVLRPLPAPVDLGPRARVLTLVRVDGPGEAPVVVVHTLKGRAARQGWFRVEAWAPGEPADASGTRAYVTLDVVEWRADEARTRDGVTPEAVVRLVLRAARGPEGPWGPAVDAGGLVTGGTLDPSEGSGARPEQLLGEACLRAVDDLLRTLAPRARMDEVALDVDDDRLRPGASFASDGDLEAARASFEALRARHPDLPGAAYDLGVVTEAQGDVERAAALYEEAAKKKDDPRYRKALDAVHQRLGTVPTN